MALAVVSFNSMEVIVYFISQCVIETQSFMVLNFLLSLLLKLYVEVRFPAVLETWFFITNANY